MTPFRPAVRRLAAALVAAAAGLAALPTDSADAAAPRPVPVSAARLVPTAAAQAAGVVPGDAPMGWRQHRSRAALDASSRAAAPFVPSGVLGIDVSSWQGNVDWAAQAALGKRFAYVKATEGTTYRNPYFGSQYGGSYRAGLIRGAYHFALPSKSGGKKQAAYFVRNGGGWSPDGRTLPGVLDIEYNPYGATCYGKTKKQMVRWIRAFVTEYKRRTSRDAVIYTTTDWWTRCTGNSTEFSATNPLWLARYATTPGTLPGGWQWPTFWQYSNNPIDQNRFSARYSRLVVLARDAS